MGRLAPHTSLAPNTTLSTYPNCCLAALLPPLFSTPTHSAHSPPPSPLIMLPNHLPNKPSVTHTQQHQTAPPIIANHRMTPHNYPCISASFIPITQPPQSHHNLLPALPHSNPPNPHFRQPQTITEHAADSRTDQQRPAMGAGEPAAAYQFQPQSGLAPRSRWWSPHQAKNRGCDVPATDRVRDTS